MRVPSIIGFDFNAGALPPVSNLHNARVCAYTLRNQARAQSAWAAQGLEGHIAGAPEKIAKWLVSAAPGLLPGPDESFPVFRAGCRRRALPCAGGDWK